MKINNPKQFDIPILFIIFRRKDAALKVIDAISKVKPKTLYISQDGPKDIKQKKETEDVLKAVLSRITWKCDLTVWTHTNNLGLNKHIPNALDKFFLENEYGIYLEDDTVPSKEFFYYEKELLVKYKDDRNIFAINGTNLYPKLVKNTYSYFLTELGCFWGVGMWRRSWKLYDSNISDLKNFTYNNYKDYIFDNKFIIYLKTFLNLIKGSKLNTWDYQLTYSAIKNRKYFVSPSTNLVNNIGFGKTSTDPFLQKYVTEISVDNSYRISHPKKVMYNKIHDKLYFHEMYKMFYPRIISTYIFFKLPYKLRNTIIKIVKYISNV